MYKAVRWLLFAGCIFNFFGMGLAFAALPPEITFATFPQSFIVVGPVTNSEIIVNASVCDAAGNTYVTGSFMGRATFGTVVLNSSGGFDNDDVYVVKYDPAGNVLWAKSAGGSGKDYGQAIALDGTGGFFLSGSSDSSPFQLGSFSITTYGRTMFMAHYDGNGTALWAQRGGAWLKNGASLVSASMTITGMAKDAGGNVIVGGSFTGSPSIGGSLSAPQGTGSTILSNKNTAFPTSYQDLFLAKFAANGSLLWATNHGSTNTEFASSIAVDSAGSIYAAGGYMNNTTLGAKVYTNAASGMFLAKFSSAGAALWSTSLSDPGSSNPGYGWAVAVDSSDRVNLGFQSNVSPFKFNGYSITNYLQSTSFGNVFMGFLAQFDTSGNVVWLKQTPFYGGGPGPGGNASTLAVDKLNNIYLGSTGGLVTNTYYVGASALSILKSDSSGQPLWTNTTPQFAIGLGLPSLSVDDNYITHVTTTLTGGENTSLALGWMNIYPFTAFGYNQLLFTIAPSFAPVAPQILQQPANMVFQPPQGLTNAVSARGWPAPTYAWYIEGAKYPFSTNFQFTISPSSFSNRTNYYVVVSNPSGSVTSLVVHADAKLAFLSIPPSTIYALNGSTLALSGSATGTTAIAYQWRLNSTNIANATSPALALSNMTTNQAGNYTLVISNGAGSITSAPPSVVVVLPFGALDPSWTNTYVHNVMFGIVAMTRAPDGSYYTANGQNAGHMTANGAFDPSFIDMITFYYHWSTGSTDFKGPSVIQREPDGKLLLAGNFKAYYPTRLTYTNLLRMARLNPNGTVDGSFNVGAGPLNTVDGDSYTQVESVIRLANGQYLLAGTFNRFNGLLRTNIVRLNNDGSVDPAFPAHSTAYQAGSSSFGAIHAIQLQSDGKILLGGEFEFIDGQANHCLARLNADGTLDTGFVQSTFPAPPFARVKSVLALADGKILASGSWTSPTNKGVARFNSDGSRDASWVGSMPGETYTITLLPGNKLVMGGNEFVKRTTYDGAGDTTFDPGTFFTGQQTYAIVLEPTGNLMVGGSPYGMRRLFLEPAPVSLPMLSSASTMSFMNGQFQLSACGGVDGQSVVVQASSDLITWTSLSTNLLSGGCLSYTDTTFPALSKRYYRLMPWP